MYNVTASTANGCVGLGNIKIKTFKGPDIYVPNAFSPNNDKLNDLLKPILIGMKTLHYFTIYNRYGQVLFTTSTENAGWDGSFKGKLQAMGGYVWIAEAVDYKGNIIQRKGVTLLVQ
ncbi:MAG: T9SS type B sorting domain-containing protein [Chitinophagaceae bacterium]